MSCAGKGLAASLLSLSRPFCCMFLDLRLLQVFRNMFTILFFTIIDGFLQLEREIYFKTPNPTKQTMQVFMTGFS